MPYIITSSLLPQYQHTGAVNPTAERTAVATLDEAECAVELLIEDHGGSIDEWPDIPEAGGTVGPLYDSTIIEVQQVEWIGLARMVGLDCGPLCAGPNSDILAAFNDR